MAKASRADRSAFVLALGGSSKSFQVLTRSLAKEKLEIFFLMTDDILLDSAKFKEPNTTIF